MNREEAIKDLKTLKEFFEEQSGAIPLSIEYAIKKLEQEPCDAVSRKEVMNMLHNHAFDYATSTKISALLKTMRGEVDRMPSVTPAEKVGQWEWVQYDSNPNIGNWHCSECRTIIPHMPEEIDNTPIYKWCPMCGAKMQEVKE